MDHPLEPDPALGVFATMLVVEGSPLELEPHLAQLRTSARALYGVELPERAAAALAEERGRGLALGRLRLSLVPRAGGEPRLEAVASAIGSEVVLPDWGAALDLRTAVVDGWPGAHKWVDRRLLERLEADAAPDAALLVAPDGRVLETTRANVLAADPHGVLRTPPADGAILPGVTRARVLALARAAGVAVREEPLRIGDLRAAREVVATGSLRGVEPVRSLDGEPIGGWGEVTAALAGALRRRWRAEARSMPAGQQA